MTDKQADLFRGKNWRVVPTLRADGTPHSTPVSIDTDGEPIAVLPAEDQQAGYVSVTGRA